MENTTPPPVVPVTAGPPSPAGQPSSSADSFAPVAPNPAEPSPGQSPAELDPSAFARCSGETPRAFAAFLVYFQLGQTRSLTGVADALGENPATVRNWSSRFKWSHRLHAFYSGLLHTQAQSEVARQRQDADAWARRTREFRDQEWVAGQKLLAAVLCFLETFGDREVEKMNLGQVSRALQIFTRISRQALRGDLAADELAPTPHQTELLAALKKAYGQSAVAVAPQPSPVTKPHD